MPVLEMLMRSLGVEKAKTMLIELTDWMLGVTSGLNEDQIQELLISEHGGT